MLIAGMTVLRIARRLLHAVNHSICDARMENNNNNKFIYFYCAFSKLDNIKPNTTER
jgi:hypothetical protein